MRRSSLFFLLLLGGCIVPIHGPGCMEDPSPAFSFTCAVGTSRGCAADELCVDDGAPRCRRVCSSQVACGAGEACTPNGPDSLVQLCRPIDCDAGTGCGGAPPVDDPMLAVGQGGSALGPGGPIAGDAWPQYGHDARHSGRSAAIPSHAPGLRWKCELPGGTGWTDLVVDAERNVYAFDGQQLYAIDPTGKLRWQAGKGVQGVVVEPGGDVIWTEPNGLVHGAKSDGTPTFDLQIPSTMAWLDVSRPTLGAGGVVYLMTWGIFTGTAALQAVDPTGQLLWTQPIGSDNHRPGQPAQDDDGSFAVALSPTAGTGSVGLTLVKAGPTGAVVWSRPLPTVNAFPSTPAFGPNGSIRASVWEHMVDFSGAGDTLFSTILTGRPTDVTPLDVDGTIYIGGGGAIDQAGDLLWNTWSAIPIGDSTLAPALTADGILVTHDEHGLFHGFHDGKIVWSAAAGGGPTSPVIIGPDATIYAAGGATVFALR